jgi:hypothetical protein
LHESEPDRIPETEPHGSLDPPGRKPPTAIGAGVPRPEDGRREIEVSERVTVFELAPRIAVSPAQLIGAAFHEHGRMVTIFEPIPFELAQALLAQFGYIARLRKP